MKIEIPENKKLVHELVIAIRWGDMDAMGHLNNGSYFRYLETVRIDWMYSIGCWVFGVRAQIFPAEGWPFGCGALRCRKIGV